MLTFSVQNFGPLVEGTVELRPLTIFVGPSNTGKSYMASAIYAVGMAASPYISTMAPGSSAFVRGMNSRKLFMLNMRLTQKEYNKEAMQSLREWLEQQTQYSLAVSKLSVTALPESVCEWLNEIVHQQLVSFRLDTADQLCQLHGEKSKFVRQGVEPSDFQLSIQRDAPMLRLNVQLSESSKQLLEFDISQADLFGYSIESMLEFFKMDETESSGWRIDHILTDWTDQSVFSEFSPQSYYLPVARSGIVQGHKVLAAALARQSRRIGLEPISIPSLPGVTTEFLGHLIELDRRMAGRPGFPNELGAAIGFIENSVLHGKIDLDESGGLPTPDIVYLPKIDGVATGKFTLEHTSSMVSELAPLILFLKYRVNPGDLLILEEPESHLHPAAQLQMARGIARLVNAGVRVLITTHSGDFMGQIDNLISMSNVSRETAKSEGLDPEDCLYPGQVSAYGFRFDASRGGSVVDPLPVGSDVGIEDQEFLPVSEYLYKQAIAFQRNRIE